MVMVIYLIERIQQPVAEMMALHRLRQPRGGEEKIQQPVAGNTLQRQLLLSRGEEAIFFELL